MHRILLGAGHSHGHDDHGEGDHDASQGSTLDVRIVAIFVIMVASLAGSVPPLFSAAFKPDHWSFRFQRAFGGGVILALALVHIALHAIAELENVSTFPLGGVTIVLGIVFMMLIEGFVVIWTGHTHSHLHIEVVPSKADEIVNSSGAHSHAHAPAQLAPAHAGRATSGQQHGHMGSQDSNEHEPSASAVASKVVAYMMELGCVFHSFIIGMDLGVMESDRATAISLLIALSFHQLLEGISLGSVVRAARFTCLKSLSMVTVYSLTTPVGIAVGIALTGAYQPDSRTASLLIGILTGLSAGILLHIALVQLLAPLFRDRCEESGSRLRLPDHIITTTGLLLGAGFMCALALWA